MREIWELNSGVRAVCCHMFERLEVGAANDLPSSPSAQVGTSSDVAQLHRDTRTVPYVHCIEGWPALGHPFYSGSAP